MSLAPRALRAPDHGRPYDWPFTEDREPSDPPSLVVYPSDDDEPEVALWGADGQPLHWHDTRRPIGYRRLDTEDETP